MRPENGSFHNLKGNIYYCFSKKSHGQVKWYTLPFQLMHVLFLWYIRPKDGSFVNLKGKIYYCMFSKKFQSSKMVHFTFPIDVYSILMVYQTRKGSQIHFQLLLVLSGLVSPKSF